MKSKVEFVRRWKVQVRITQRTRCKKGFVVTGPDGQTYHARSKAEALSNLKVRMMCLTLPAWSIKPGA